MVARASTGQTICNFDVSGTIHLVASEQFPVDRRFHIGRFASTLLNMDRSIIPPPVDNPGPATVPLLPPSQLCRFLIPVHGADVPRSYLKSIFQNLFSTTLSPPLYAKPSVIDSSSKSWDHVEEHRSSNEYSVHSKRSHNNHSTTWPPFQTLETYHQPIIQTCPLYCRQQASLRTS